MILLASGSDTVDLSGDGVDIPLDGTDTSYVNSDLSGKQCYLFIKSTNVNTASVLTLTLKIGSSTVNAQIVNSPDGRFTGSFTQTTGIARFQFPLFVLGIAAGDFDTLEVLVSSNGADATAIVSTQLYDVDATDQNGRTNVGRWLDTGVTKSANNLPDVNVNEILDTTPSLTNGNIDSNAAQVGGNAPLSDVATETKQDIIDTIVDALLSRLGTPADIDTGGATIADNLKKLADDNAGADFDATLHSQKAMVGQGVGLGVGSIVVDHDYGGADALAYKTEGGAGIDNAVIRAYLKSDYDAGNTGSAYIKAMTTTNVNGRWTNQMNLDPATYMLYFFKQGAYSPSTQEVSVE